MRDQAIAAALHVARKMRADGGQSDDTPKESEDKYGFRTVKIGSTTGVYREREPYFDLISIRTPQAKRGQGGAHKVLQHMIAKADEANKPARLIASPLDRKTGTAGLVNFYQKYGFQPTGEKANPMGDPLMERPPQKTQKAFGGSMATTTTHEGPGAFMGNHVTKHVGPIKSAVAGRTDHLPMHVPHGAYVIPADIISAMGEGNTAAGFKHMEYIFGGTPYEGKGDPYNQPNTPYGAKMPGRAAGGAAGAVPIVAAGGEYVLSPEQVMRVGDGDLDLGHRVLDDFVKRKRAETIKTLQKLPGPRRD